MKGILIARGRGIPRKTIGETINKDLDINGLSIDMVHDKTLWRHLLHIVDPSKWQKAWFSCYCCLETNCVLNFLLNSLGPKN